MRAHWRNPAGSGKQVGLLVMFVLAMFVLGSKPMGGAAPVEQVPGPQSTVHPIKWPVAMSMSEGFWHRSWGAVAEGDLDVRL
ncbi:hypothetical protein [Streptomyces sp. NPDC059949]|uniref:hypothetical protein n=1 Tax=Streptomyces sp. NPDC059949 TaxID=3347013 RepID=UPI003656FF3E